MRWQWFKEWRILLLIGLVLISLLLIIPSSARGVLVKSVSPNSPLAGKLMAGERLERINERDIASPDDIYIFENFTGMLRFVHNGKLDLVEVRQPGLGLTLSSAPSSRLSFGLDIIGGTRVLLEPTQNVSPAVIEQTIGTLQTRINIYGMREARFQSVSDVSGNRYVQIEMAGATPAEIEGLLARQGTFEGKIPKIIRLTNGTGSLLNASVSLAGDKLLLGGREFKINETFESGGISWQYINSTNGSAVVMAKVFTGPDIHSVCLVEQAGVCASRVQKVSNGWEFIFQVTLTQEAAERFAAVTRGMPTVVDPRTGSVSLESRIFFYIDDQPVTDLSISGDLAGRALTDPSITGFRASRDDALKEKLSLQSILQSGALPVPLRTARMDTVSASLGAGFLNSAALAGGMAVLAVCAVVGVRYRRWKIALPTVFVSLCEVIIILGAIALIGYTLDLSAIAGIIATVGTSVDAQVMVIDELSSGERLYTPKQRLKRAFFMIFGSAGTVIAAMLPLAVIGIGVMRGFALVTMLGVLIGIFITRPAFARLAEKILEQPEQPKS